MQSSAGMDLATRSGLISVLQQTRASATLYEVAAKQYGKVLPFTMFAHTERRHEKLLLSALKRARVTLPPPPKVAAPEGLKALLTRALQQEREAKNEAERCLQFIKSPELVDLLTTVKLTSRDLHQPPLVKKLAATLPRPSKQEIQRLRDKPTGSRG